LAESVTNEKAFVVAGIINTCGPLPDEWQQLNEVKEMMNILQGYSTPVPYQYSLQSRLPAIPPLCDFLTSMLQIDPRTRARAADMLRHQWLLV